MITYSQFLRDNKSHKQKINHKIIMKILHCQTHMYPMRNGSMPQHTPVLTMKTFVTQRSELILII